MGDVEGWPDMRRKRWGEQRPSSRRDAARIEEPAKSASRTPGGIQVV